MGKAFVNTPFERFAKKGMENSSSFQNSTLKKIHGISQYIEEFIKVSFRELLRSETEHIFLLINV